MKPNNLRKLRESADLSQLDLSMRCRIAPNVLSLLENGKIFPYPGWRKRLADALRVDEAAIFPGYQEKD